MLWEKEINTTIKIRNLLFIAEKLKDEPGEDVLSERGQSAKRGAAKGNKNRNRIPFRRKVLDRMPEIKTLNADCSARVRGVKQIGFKIQHFAMHVF